MTNRELRSKTLSGIARRAPHYTPEWRFTPEHPDAGTALAMLWADMHAETLERFERLPDNYRRALLDAIGSAPRPAVAASGILAFTVREDAGDLIIPKGTVVAAPANPEAALVTSYDLAASPVRISDIYRVIPQHDLVERFDSRNDINFSGPARGMAHLWTFAHDFALNVSHAASLRLTPEVEDGGLDALAASAWEYRDGDDWRELTVIRDGLSLLCVFPKHERLCDAVRVRVTRDAVLHSLTAKPSASELFPDALYSDGAQEQDGFYPFGQRFLPGVCAYFANADALTKPGARIELSFTLSYHDFEIEGYSETQIHLKKLMRASDFEPPKEYTITAAETKWEYYNGVGWAALNADAGAALFNGNKSGRIRIAFDCPDDLRHAAVGAHDLPFIRVRLIAADNLYRQRGCYNAPFLSDTRFSYRYKMGVPITDISAAEHLDVFNKTLPARLAAPPEGLAAVYFASDTAFMRGTILFHLKSGGASAGRRWEYLTDTGWIALGVRDDTDGFSKTGILSYQTSQPAKNARLWGRAAYWIRLILGDTGQADAYMHGLYENAVRAVARVPGKGSALPAGAFTTIVTPFAGIEFAVNPIAVYGGADAEGEGRIITRLSAALSHCNRAVSREDCEELALEASPRVQRVRYYPHTDERGAYAYGQSCLVILASDAEGFGFDELRDDIWTYITPHRAMGAERLSIIPPRYIAVNVSASVLIESHAEALTVKNRVDDALTELLSPENWEIGQLPAPGQINAAIRTVTGVVQLIKSDASYTMPSGVSAGYARAKGEAFILPVSGSHDITLISGES